MMSDTDSVVMLASGDTFDTNARGIVSFEIRHQKNQNSLADKELPKDEQETNKT